MMVGQKKVFKVASPLNYIHLTQTTEGSQHNDDLPCLNLFHPQLSGQNKTHPRIPRHYPFSDQIEKSTNRIYEPESQALDFLQAPNPDEIY